MSVKSDQIVNIPLVLEIPDEPEYCGKKYVFIVKAELKETEVPLEIYSSIYVETGLFPFGKGMEDEAGA